MHVVAGCVRASAWREAGLHCMPWRFLGRFLMLSSLQVRVQVPRRVGVSTSACLVSAYHPVPAYGIESWSGLKISRLVHGVFWDQSSGLSTWCVLGPVFRA